MFVNIKFANIKFYKLLPFSSVQERESLKSFNHVFEITERLQEFKRFSRIQNCRAFYGLSVCLQIFSRLN